MKKLIKELKEIEMYLITLKLEKERSFHQLIQSQQDDLDLAESLIRQTSQLDSAHGYISLTIQTLERYTAH